MFFLFKLKSGTANAVPAVAVPTALRLKSFQYEMRAIFTESLGYETLFNTVVYGNNETHIIVRNSKT